MADDYGLTVGEDFQCGMTVWPEGENSDSTTPSAGEIRQALDSFPIPAPKMIIQPPGGRTLVNFDTNFYTTATTIHRSTTLLDQTIDFRITPTTYTWHFDDGTTKTTTKPGAPYPTLDVTHRYTTKDTFQPHLETTYTADYRISGGPWQPVDGTLVLADDPLELQTVTARPLLVAPDGYTTD